MTTVRFAFVSNEHAPKRKMIGFVPHKTKSTFGEFQHPDVVSWVNNVYQDKTFKTQKDFNEAYDAGLVEVLYWHNKPMVLTKEDIDNCEEELENLEVIPKMKALLETGEKVIFVY